MTSLLKEVRRFGVGWLLLVCLAGAEPVSVPAFTGYFSPDGNRGARREKDGRLTGWRSGVKIEWYGRLQQGGSLQLALEPAGALPEKMAPLKLTVTHQQDPDFTWSGVVKPSGNGARLDVGTLTVKGAGYHKFVLEATGDGALPDLAKLTLDGAAAQGAHFSTVERKNAASVHLNYPVPAEMKNEVEWFYLELTPRTEPVASYYEACGWHRGYFGMQVNGPTERRFIFSVWDSGNEAVDRNKVGEDNRVKLLAKGPEVNAGDFGNEGTGGHSHVVYPWKLGGTFRFLMRAEVDGDTSTYTGWFFDPEKKAWRLVASFRAPKDGKYLRGLYSFNENFGGSNGDERRVCEFGNGWIRSKSGKWAPLTDARFTHDGHGKEQRLDRSAGVVNGRFYLANGGFVDDATPGAVTTYNAPLKVGVSGKPPGDDELAQLPLQ